MLTLRSSTALAKGEITSIAISHASPAAALATYTRGPLRQSWIDMFRLSSGRSISKIEGDRAFYSPSGTRLATLHEAATRFGAGTGHTHQSNIVIRAVDSGKAQLEIRGVNAGPLAWSPDGSLIAATEDGNRVGIWDTRVGLRVGRVVTHIDTITHIAFTQANTVVTLSRDGTLRITDPQTSRTLQRLEIEGQAASNPRFLAVSPTGNRVLSVWGTTVQVWAPQVNHITAYSLSSVRSVEGWPLAATPDARFLALWTELGFDVIDVMTGATVYENNGGALVTSGSFGEDGSVLMLGRMDGIVETYNVNLGAK